MDTRRASFGLALGAVAVLMPTIGRGVGTVSLGLLTAAVVLLIGARGPVHMTWPGASLATFVGLLPALLIFGAVHDLVAQHPPVVVSRLVLLVAWVGSGATLGIAVAARVEGRRTSADVWGRILGVAAVTAYIGGAIARLLLPGRTPSDRLAWLLAEEDNAAFVGVAREILTNGPRGDWLVEDLGAAFMNLPYALLRMSGGPLTGDDDLRLQAIALTVVSTLVAILLAGLAMSLLSALPHHVHRPRTQRAASRTSIVMIVAGSVGAALASLAVFSLLVVLPMRTGFLTFVWGLTLVLLATTVVSITPTDAGWPARVVLLVSLASTAVLLLGSWPFIATALAPLGLIVLTWVDWSRVRTALRRRPAIGAAVLATIGLTTVVGTILAARLPQVTRVIELGTDLLTIGGSGIFADQPIRRMATILMVIAAVLVLSRRPIPAPVAIAVLGPPLGAGALMLGIRIATDMFTDGTLGYAGVKLSFGVVTLSLAIGAIAVISHASRLGAVGSVLALGLVVLPLTSSVTAGAHSGWWDRTAQYGSPHAMATEAAIRATNEDLPIRCLPSPGTAITDRTRFAAYFCIRWMEEGFNAGKFRGHAATILNAEGDTYEEIVERILAEDQSNYLFAYPFTMGQGWFGWTSADG